MLAFGMKKNDDSDEETPSSKSASIPGVEKISEKDLKAPIADVA